MSILMKKVALTLSDILDNENGAIEDKDRISLIKYGKNLRRIFTLVEKEKNYTLFGTTLYYMTSVSYEKTLLYK